MRRAPLVVLSSLIAVLTACEVGSPVHIGGSIEQFCGDSVSVGDVLRLQASTEGGGWFGPSPYGSDDRPARFRWQVSDPTVATVDRYGVMRVLRPGNLTVHVETKGYRSARDYVAITPRVQATVPDSIELRLGDSAWVHTEERRTEGDPPRDPYLERLFLEVRLDGVARPAGDGRWSVPFGRDSLLMVAVARGTTSFRWCAGTRAGQIRFVVRAD
jgi:hypothetical protein